VEKVTINLKIIRYPTPLLTAFESTKKKQKEKGIGSCVSGPGFCVMPISAFSRFNY